MTNLGQDWVCSDRSKYYHGRQSALSCRGMAFLGQDWVCSDRSKYYHGRQSALSCRGMAFLGQDWVCSDRSKYYHGRQSALSCRGMTILGQNRSCLEKICKRGKMTDVFYVQTQKTNEIIWRCKKKHISLQQTFHYLI